MSGEAFQKRIALAQLARRHQAAPKPFTPPALLPPVEGDLIVEACAAPAIIDREHTKLGVPGWMPFKPTIPFPYRHGRPAGEVKEIKSTGNGLHVRALVTGAEAKRCSHFSVAATVHH